MSAGGSWSVFGPHTALVPVHLSGVSQALAAGRHSRPALPGENMHPLAGLHESTVHRF